MRLEKVVPCNVSFINALKNKYGQDYHPGIDQEVSAALMKQFKMSSFELVGMQKVQKKQALVSDFFLYLPTYLFAFFFVLAYKQIYNNLVVLRS